MTRTPGLTLSCWCSGDSQHVSTLSTLHADLRQNLADCIYCYAAQAGLPTAATLK